MYQAKHYAENEQNGGSKAAMILSVAVTLAIIFILGILAWALPQRTYSEYERRDLTQMPEFSVESFFKGEYTAQIELSYADTFAFRDQFVRAKSLIEDCRGIHSEGTIHGKVPVGDGEEESTPSEDTETKPDNNTSTPENPDISQNSQSESQIKAMILNGRLKEGDALPSMRNLAKDLRISMITTKRAYEELEKRGFIVTVAGKGCFVAEKNTELVRENHLLQMEEHLTQAAEHAKLRGVSAGELQDIILRIYKGE